jgi:uncharacterized membrane protein YeaQ/YmgE (transglycosylase-associated protein family)
MPDLGFFGWILVGLLAGAIAGAFTGDRGFGCLGTMLVGIFGGLIGGWIWVEVFNQSPASGLLGALVVATAGSVLVLLLMRALRRSP